ncbi:techylectin-like protein [Stegodyphus dumicola]|uniref:techylectin-like protein n=1 Tax=Stegodyphus dumicola TaxID=202533 RepID=UPI0015AFDE2B|nr:techylectin-like protein [Stegodyphus dumicola]
MIKHYCRILLAFLAVVYGEDNRNTTFTCGQKEKSYSYLDLATEMILKAKENYPNCQEIGGNSSRYVDCAELFRAGFKRSGVYTICLRSRVIEDKSLEVYCDMTTDGGGWVVIQRRGNFLRPNDYFYKDWQSYKNGFGDIERDFWLGNDNIFALTNQGLYSIRFDLTDVEGSKRYALYDTFWIDDEDHKYTLHIADYSGDAGDSITVQHNNQKFSTKDQKNDNNKDQSCAQEFKGAWWYNACHDSNLNGLYLRGKHDSYADGVVWQTWKGYKESMDTTEIKIRPKNFRKTQETLITPLRR